LNQQEREMIDGLFERLRQAEQQGEARDPEAEALIQERMAKQPAASYLLAQVVLMQEQGLKNLQSRVEQLEQALAERPQASSSGFLGGLFGGGSQQAKPTPPPPPRTGAQPPSARAAQPQRGGWTNPTDPAAARPGMAAGMPGQAGAAGHGGGGGFMAGAMQTAMGVAGGVLLANAVTGMFADDSEAAEAAAPVDEGLEPPVDEPMIDEPMEAPPEEDGGLFGGEEEF
jgi:hypothetical protein